MLTAEELVPAIRVHLDRVHDAVRRLGCAPAPAADVVRRSAEDLVERASYADLTVEQAVGAWFAGARTAAVRRASGAGLALDDLAPSDDDQSRLAAALDDLPEPQSFALLLRDAYDLPSGTVGAALGLDDADALALVARARLAFLPRYDDDLPLSGPGLSVPEHADLAGLARLAEPRPVAARDATTRRHALSCVSCGAVLDEQARAHLLLSGLAVIALPERSREQVLAAVERRARAVLPAAGAPVVVERTSAVRLDQPEPPRGLSPLLVVLSLVLAVLAGLGLGLLLHDRDQPERLAGAEGALPPGVTLASPPPAPPSVLPSPPTVPEQRPDTDVVVVPPPPLPSPSPSPSPSPTPPPAAVVLSPATGPDGTPVTVTGTGFPAGSPVVVELLGAAGPLAQVDTTAGDDGTFEVELVAADPEGGAGPREVVATAGEVSARAAFTVTAPE